MSNRVGFGRGVAPGQNILPGTPQAMLPSFGFVAPAANAITSVKRLGAAPEASYFGGRVAGLALPVFGQDGAGFDVVGAWGSVPNATLSLARGSVAVQFDGFVHVDAVAVGAGDVSLVLAGTQRGNIITGTGDDRIRVETLRSTAPGEWSSIVILSGAGNDVVEIAPFDLAGRIGAGDATFMAGPPAGTSFVETGAGQITYIDLGAGADSFTATGLTRDLVLGGSGRDTIEAGRADDRLFGGADGDRFVFRAGDGADAIADFAAGGRSVLAKTETTIDFGVPTGIARATTNILQVAPGHGGATGVIWEDIAWTGGGLLATATPAALIGLDAFLTPLAATSGRIRAPHGLDLKALTLTAVSLGGSALDMDGLVIEGLRDGVVVTSLAVAPSPGAGAAQAMRFGKAWRDLDEVRFGDVEGLFLLDDVTLASVGDLSTPMGAWTIDFESEDRTTPVIGVPGFGAVLDPRLLGQGYGAAGLSWQADMVRLDLDAAALALPGFPEAASGPHGILLPATTPIGAPPALGFDAIGDFALDGLSLSFDTGAAVTVEGWRDSVLVDSVTLTSGLAAGNKTPQSFGFGPGFALLDAVRFIVTGGNAGLDDLTLTFADPGPGGALPAIIGSRPAVVAPPVPERIDFDAVAGLPVLLTDPLTLVDLAYGPLPDDYGITGLRWGEDLSLLDPVGLVAVTGGSLPPGFDLPSGRFGLLVPPSGDPAGATLAMALTAERLGFDLVGFDIGFMSLAASVTITGLRGGLEVASRTITPTGGTQATQRVTFDGADWEGLDALRFEGMVPGQRAVIDDLLIETVFAPMPAPKPDQLSFPDLGIDQVLAMLAGAEQVGTDTWLRWGDQSVRLEGVQKANLGIEDFAFA